MGGQDIGLGSEVKWADGSLVGVKGYRSGFIGSRGVWWGSIGGVMGGEGV